MADAVSAEKRRKSANGAVLFCLSKRSKYSGGGGEGGVSWGNYCHHVQTLMIGFLLQEFLSPPSLCLKASGDCDVTNDTRRVIWVIFCCSSIVGHQQYCCNWSVCRQLKHTLATVSHRYGGFVLWQEFASVVMSYRS